NLEPDIAEQGITVRRRRSGGAYDEQAARAAETQTYRLVPSVSDGPVGLEQRRPALDLLHHEVPQPLRRARGRLGDSAAQIEQPLTRARFVQSLRQGRIQLGNDFFRGAFGREQRVPGADLELG